jgi:hypothetical protein
VALDALKELQTINDLGQPYGLLLTNQQWNIVNSFCEDCYIGHSDRSLAVFCFGSLRNFVVLATDPKNP